MIWFPKFMPTCKEAWSDEWRARICFVFLKEINLTWGPGKQAQKRQLEKDKKLGCEIWFGQNLGWKMGFLLHLAFLFVVLHINTWGKCNEPLVRWHFILEEYLYTWAVDYRDNLPHLWDSINWSQMSNVFSPTINLPQLSSVTVVTRDAWCSWSQKQTQFEIQWTRSSRTLWFP